MVKQYVRAPELRWDTCMKDDDGGQSLIAAGIRAVTSADAKQDQLQKELAEVQNRLLQLSRGWVVDPDTNLDREKRLAGRQEGDRLARRRRGGGLLPRSRLAGIAVRRRRRGAAAFRLRATRRAAATATPCPGNCTTSCTSGPPSPCPSDSRPIAARHEEGEPWLDPNDVNAFTRYLRDYLLHGDGVRASWSGVLQPVVSLKTRDEAARRRARRKYVRIILNDYVLNPGPSQAPMPLGRSPARSKRAGRGGRTSAASG